MFFAHFFEQDKRQETDAVIRLADPTIFYHDSIYYLYGTGSRPYNNGFVVYTSKDLKTWSGPAGVSNGYALKKGDTFGTGGFWAPQVFHHDGMFYMAYTANEHIAIAKSKSPLGPFTQEDKIALVQKDRQIDPFVFFDSDGKKYLYHVVVGNGANRIFGAEIKDDFSAMKAGTSKECISFTDRWENTENEDWAVSEGPTVIKRNKLYYLLYSANHFKSKDYAVGYATSTSPLGPWKKYSGNPLISRKHTKKNGSGHGDLFKDAKGNFKYVLHTHFSDTSVSPRLTGIIDLEFKKDKIESKPASFYYLKTSSQDQK